MALVFGYPAFIVQLVLFLKQPLIIIGVIVIVVVSSHVWRQSIVGAITERAISKG